MTVSKPGIGMGVTVYGYSDSDAFTITDVDPKGKWFDMCVDIAKLKDGWKPEFQPGGFCGHCSNNSSQTYTYERNFDVKPVRVSLRKNGKWVMVGQRSKGAQRIELGIRRKFHDYNF